MAAFVTMASSAFPTEQKTAANSAGITVPLLDKSWLTDVVFLKYVPHPCNDSKDMAQAELEEREAMLTLVARDVKWLLQQKYHLFWSQILYDDTLAAFIDSYLQHAPRDHDGSAGILKGTTSLDELEKELFRSAFMVMVRTSTHKETKADFMEPKTFGGIVYDYYLYDIAKIFDIVTIWAPGNVDLVAKMVGNIFKQEPRYYNDLDENMKTIHQVFTMTASSAAEMNTAQASDLLDYAIDISATMYWFLQVCPQQALDILVKNEMLLHFAKFYESVVPAVEKTFEGGGSGGVRLLSAAKTKASPADKKHLKTSKLWLTMAAQNLLQCCYARQVPSVVDGAAQVDLCSVLDRLFECERFVADWSNSRPMVESLKQLASLNGIEPMRLEYFVSVAEAVVDADNELHDEDESKVSAPPAGARMPPPPFSHAGGASSAGAAADDSGLDESIRQVQELFPDLGDGFVKACLKEFTNPEVVIDRLLSDSLPPSLAALPRDMGRAPRKPPAPQAAMVPGPLLQEFRKGRHNIFDGDEFDLFSGKAVDTSRISMGKKRQASTEDFLNDKSSVRQNMELFLDTQYSDVEGEYDDEYDDTYDDIGGFDKDAKTEDLLVPNANHQSGKRAASPAGGGADGADGAADDAGEDGELTGSGDLARAPRWGPDRGRGGRVLKGGQRGGRGVCFAFQRGACSRGDSCAFIHELEAAASGGGGGGAISSGGGGGGSGGGGRGRGRGGGQDAGNRPKVDLTVRTDKSLRARAVKDKNKSSRANHNRKRGADKKRAQGGLP